MGDKKDIIGGRDTMKSMGFSLEDCSVLFIKQTSLVVLGTSLNGRYIDRMMIDEDL